MLLFHQNLRTKLGVSVPYLLHLQRLSLGAVAAPMSLPHSALISPTLQSPTLTSKLPLYSANVVIFTRRQPSFRVFAGKRTGKQRYPSEKKRLKQRLKLKEASKEVTDKFEGFWKLSKLSVPVHKDPGKDFIGVSDGLLDEIAKVLKFPVRPPLSTWEFVNFAEVYQLRPVYLICRLLRCCLQKHLLWLGSLLMQERYIF